LGFVDTAATAEAAIELARAVNERERAAREKKEEEQAAKAEPEVAGFETQHERTESSEGEAETQTDAQEDTQNRGVLGMPLAEEGRGEQTQYVGEGRGTVVLTPDAAQRRDALAAQEPVLIESSLSDNLSKEERKAKAKELYPLNQVFTNRATGRAIKMVKRAIGKLRDHSASLRSLKIMPHLKELVENAIPLFENTGEGKHWHHYGVAATIDGEAFIVRLVAYENVNGQLHMDVFYDAQTTPRKAMEGLTSLGQSAETNRDAQSRSPSRDIAVTWARAVKAKEAAPVLGSPLRQGQPNAARVSYEGEAAEAGTALAKRKRPVSMPEVMAALAKVVETIGGKAKAMFRKGHAGAGKGFLGHYRPVSQITRIATTGDISTAAHELAHALDALLFKPYTHWEENTLGLSPNQRAELYRLGKQLYGDANPSGGYHSEGFAEFVRLWFTDSEQAKQKAPAFAAWLEGKLGEEPKLAKAMATAQALAHRYHRQGAEARADSGIVQTPTRLQRAVGMTRQQMRDFYENWIEAAGSIEKFSIEAARRRALKELPAGQDPYLTLVARRMTADAVVRNMATKGMIDWAGNATGGPALADAFALVGKGRKVRQFLIYLWSKRTIALHDDPRGPRNSGLAIEDARHLVEKYEREQPQFIRAAQIFYDWHAGVLDFAAQASPALAETVKKIREVDPGFYIPLQREFSELDRQYKAGGSGSAARAELSKRLEGSGRRILDLVESSMAQAKNIVLKAQQRAVIDQIMNIARTQPGMGHWAVELNNSGTERAPSMDAIGSKDFGDKGLGSLVDEMVGFFEPATELKDGEPAIFSVWENGKMRRRAWTLIR